MPDNTKSSKGFSLTNPGPKEYMIVGGIALAAGLIYFWYKNKTAATSNSSSSANQSGTTSSTGSPQGPSPTGLTLTAFKSWLQSNSASPAPAPAPAPATSTEGQRPGSPGNYSITPSANGAVATWQPVTATATGLGPVVYTVQVVDSTGKVVDERQTPSGATQGTIEGLTANTTYKFRVGAAYQSEGDQGTWGPWQTFKTS